MVDDENGVPYKGYSEEDFTFDRNILGLQVSGQVNEKVTDSTQREYNSFILNNLPIQNQWNYTVGVNWVHYTVVLHELAGWYAGSDTGPLATRDQMLSVLGSLTSIAIQSGSVPNPGKGLFDKASRGTVAGDHHHA